MSFENPRLLFSLLALIPLVFLFFLRRRKRRKEAGLFAAAAPAGERETLGKMYRSRMAYADCFFIVFLAACIAALSGPRWGEEIVADYSRGVDLIFAFDISRSMNVRDCPPLLQGQEQSSRLERALFLAHELGLGLDGMRLGTAIGKGRGVLAVPLSYDSEAVLNFLSGINQFSITGGGTNLESLIDASITAFKDNMPGRRGIVLFSDGEELSGSLEAAVSRAQNREIMICIAGMGSDQGGPVPLDDGILLNSAGSPIISARKSETLKLIAEKSGGIYADGNRTDAAAQLGAFLRSLSTGSGLLGRRTETKSQSHIFAMAALVSLGVSRLLGFSLRSRKSAAGNTLRGTLCVFFLAAASSLLGGSCLRMEGKISIMQGNYHQNRGFFNEAVSAYLHAMDYPDSALYAEYGLGSAFFAMEESGAALERYVSAEKSLDALPREQHPELRFRIKYNIGVIHFEQGDYEKAAGAFRSALEIDGSRLEAKRNLELSLLSMAPVQNPGTSALENMPEESGENSVENPGASDASLVLFEYLRRKEQDQWKSREWPEDTGFSGPDY